MLLHSMMATLSQAMPSSTAGQRWPATFFSRPRMLELLQLCIMVIFGAFGGLVYAIVTLLNTGKAKAAGDGNSWVATKNVPVGRYVGGQCVVGVGGACAAVFGIVTLGRAATNGTGTLFLEQDHLYFVALCVVGGFIANQLLKVVGEKLLEQVKQTEKKVDNLKHETDEKVNTLQAENRQLKSELASKAHQLNLRQEESEKKLDAKQQKQMSMISDVFNARDTVVKIEKLQKEKEPVGEPLTGLVETYKTKLGEYSADFPCDRALHIVYSNLYQVTGDAKRAIQILNRFIACRVKHHIDKDADVAAAWFNVACAHAQESVREGNGAQSRAEAIQALRRSLEVANQSDLQKSIIAADEDLDPLENDTDFQALLREFGITRIDKDLKPMATGGSVAEPKRRDQS